MLSTLCLRSHFFKVQKLNFNCGLFKQKWKHPEIINLKLFQKPFHTSQRQLANPLFLFLLKFKATKILKGISIIVGRSSRKIYHSLPKTVQTRISQHKIVLTGTLGVLGIISYYSYMHYDTCPITERKRWISFTKEQILVLAEMDHKNLMNTYHNKLVSSQEPLHKLCNQLVHFLVNKNSDIEVMKNINWNLNMVDDDSVVNAFVLPNGQIYVFTGMIKLLNDWEELAVVLSHEMAHAILGHVQEQQSFIIFGELLVIPLLTFLWFLLEDFSAFIAMCIENYLFPLVFEVGFNLPYSRLLEMEADEVGLNLYSKACFDPRWGVFLWDKMAIKDILDASKNQGDEVLIKYLSTHPPSEERAAVLESKLQKMFAIRDQCNCPELSTNNPLPKAYAFRKVSTNLRKICNKQKEIDEIKAATEKDPFPESKSINLDDIRLENEMNELIEEFNVLLKAEKLPLNEILSLYNPGIKSLLQFQNNRVKISAINIWNKIAGSFLQSNVKIYRSLSKRDYYSTLD